MKINAEDILNYHCPRWNELPEIELYIDQVVCFLQKNLIIFSKDEDTQILTPSMINNYVKKKVIPPPVKKKYGRSHLAYLFVICVFKKFMNISEIGESISIMKRTISDEGGYNMFCDELEAALKRTFNVSKKNNLVSFSETDTREVATLKAMVAAFADSVLVDRLIMLRK